jgi:dephospho-CoA kinase
MSSMPSAAHAEHAGQGRALISVGLTGNVGSGKSAVADLWRSAGVPVVSADELSRQAVLPGSPGLAAVAAAFGMGVLAPDGSLDRARMRALVFDDAAARERLERILHPIIAELRSRWFIWSSMCSPLVRISLRKRSGPLGPSRPKLQTSIH